MEGTPITQDRLKARRSDTARARSHMRTAGVTTIENYEGSGELVSLLPTCEEPFRVLLSSQTFRLLRSSS